MPTQVNPDNPNATGAGRLQAMVGGREPGTPSTAGKPGVQQARYAFPAPPAPNTAPPGKPPDGARAAMGSAQPTPQQPGTPAPGAAPTLAPQPSAGAPPPTPGSPQPAPGAGSSVGKGVGAPEAPPAPTVDQNGMATQTFASQTIPRAGTIVPGQAVQTPLGTVTDSPSGQKLALDANGQQKYKESMAALRGKFTMPRVMKGMQGLPQMELKLGASNYDPFAGRYHGRE